MIDFYQDITQFFHIQATRYFAIHADMRILLLEVLVVDAIWRVYRFTDVIIWFNDWQSNHIFEKKLLSLILRNINSKRGRTSNTTSQIRILMLA